MIKFLAFAGLVLLFAGLCEQAGRADTISFTGNLRSDANFTDCGAGCKLGPTNTDGDYAQWAAVAKTFHVGIASTMEAITFSYGGGANGNGKVIARNGFEPYLSLFDVAGNFLASTFFGDLCPAGANTNVDTGQCFDVALDGGMLAAGDYRIAISAFENMSFAENLGAGTLADGFTGLGNLFAGEDMHYAFDVILNSPATPVPEPQSVYLLVSAILAVGGFQKLKRG